MQTNGKLSRVLVFGATGAQGGPVVRQLLEAGIEVKAVTRTAEKVSRAFGGKAKAVAADLSDLESLRRAFNDVDAAFLHLPFIGNDVRNFPLQLGNALQAAKETHLPRLVFTTSGTTTDNMPPITMVEGNRAAERAVLSSGVPSVVLRPTIYLENLPHLFLSEMKERGVLSYPPLSPARKVSWTAQEDQARLAIAAMTSESAVGKGFDIASPEPVTGVEIAEKISPHLGREVRYEPLSPVAFGENMGRVAGEEAGKVIAEMYQAMNDLPEDGAIINLEPVLKHLAVELTTVTDWVNRQNWNFSDQNGLSSAA